VRDTRLPPDIGSRIAALGDALAACPAIVFAYLFGSAAAGRLGPFSDVDVAVYLENGADPVAVRLEAIGLVSRHLATDAVDLVVLNSAPTALAGRVLLGRRVVLDRRPFCRHRYESRTIREYLDFRHFERRLLARRYEGGGPRPAPPQAR